MNVNLLSSLLLMLMANTAISGPVPNYVEGSLISIPLDRNGYPMSFDSYNQVSNADLLKALLPTSEKDQPAAKLTVTYENKANEFRTVIHNLTEELADDSDAAELEGGPFKLEDMHAIG
ncbi:uncharacterized protein LOC117787371 [Drosophila innubila]|uniref:uncharacterized protein LOC117787371 n=1 Tax=Drosophila innubila TaxID=198719 RepID=UPI00148CE15D|nr:uncharacterized protein LOC117787371 [Drosophila innubila]